MTKKTHHLLLLSLANLLVIQGCSNFAPQTQNLTPYFDGTLKFQGTAIPQARILISLKPNDSKCMQAEKSTQTDENGNFSLKPVTQKSAYVPFMNYRFIEWTLCAEYKQQRYLLAQNDSYTTEHQNQSILINCDLAAKKQSALCKPGH